MPQGSATVPRQRSLERLFISHDRRIRRLEINKNLPNTGTAIYNVTFSSMSATALWTPDFTDAAQGIEDTIGLTLHGQGVKVPPGWVCDCVVGFEIAATSPPPTGESLEWSASAGLMSVDRCDVMLNVDTQDLAVAIPAPSGWGNEPMPVTLDPVATALGTEFTPQTMFIAVSGIQLPTPGWPLTGTG